MGEYRPRVLATICARGGSKGVPNKNTRQLRGKPLLAYAIECARECRTVGHIVFSTDSDEIALVAEKFGMAVPFRRPPEFASDTSAKIHAIRHATRYAEEHEQFFPDIVVDLDIGVPLRAPEDIDACVEILTKYRDFDAALTVYEAKKNPYFNMVEFEGGRVKLVKPPPTGIIRRQDAPPVFDTSPSVFAYRRSSLMSITHLFTGDWGGCVVPRERAIDIDDESDFRLVEFLLAREVEGTIHDN